MDERSARLAVPLVRAGSNLRPPLLLHGIVVYTKMSFKLSVLNCIVLICVLSTNNKDYYIKIFLSQLSRVFNGALQCNFHLSLACEYDSFSQSKEKMKRGSRRATIQLKGAIIGIDDEDDCTFTIRDQTRVFHFQGKVCGTLVLCGKTLWTYASVGVNRM